jgi:hypothetical protein
MGGLSLRIPLNPKGPIGIMGVQIVHNNMDFLVLMFQNERIHKTRELPSSPGYTVISVGFLLTMPEG